MLPKVFGLIELELLMPVKLPIVIMEIGNCHGRSICNVKKNKSAVS